MGLTIQEFANSKDGITDELKGLRQQVHGLQCELDVSNHDRNMLKTKINAVEKENRHLDHGLSVHRQLNVRCFSSDCFGERIALTIIIAL